MWKGSPPAVMEDGRLPQHLVAILVAILDVTISRALESGCLRSSASRAPMYHHHARQSLSKMSELAETVPGGDSAMFVSKDPQMSWKQKSCPLGF